MTSRVLCLCCGSQYDIDGDCANVKRTEHSIRRALDVARKLRELGIEPATSHDVRRVLAILDVHERLDG